MATTGLDHETEQLTLKFDEDGKLVLGTIGLFTGIECLKNENGDSSKIRELDIPRDHTALSKSSMPLKRSLSSPSDAYTILLLDDDFDIVTVFRRGLEIQGFNVVAFAEPLLALEHFQSKSKQFALVISDIRMSKMNGFEFIKKIKEIKPEVKVFLITAFEIDDIEFRRVLPSVKIDELIQKPISLKDLARRIRKHIIAK
jgi:CheY-like chemotaxis protein